MTDIVPLEESTEMLSFASTYGVIKSDFKPVYVKTGGGVVPQLRTAWNGTIGYVEAAAPGIISIFKDV